MATLPIEAGEVALPSQADAQLARDSGRILSRLLSAKLRKSLRIRIETGGEVSAESIAIPISALRLLNEILAEMAQGSAVRLVPVRAELTTRQAAEVLNVSRPFLIEQLEKGLIPYRKVGTHRRVLLADVLAYKHTMDQGRLKSLEELSAIDQRLGLGY